MFVAIMFLLVLCQINGDVVRYRCNQTPGNVSFTPASDGVQGRYTVESCMPRNPKITAWIVELWYYEDLTRCRLHKKPSFTHSQSKELIKDETNCTNVCYSMDFDLIFAGCYNIRNEFIKVGGRSTRPTDSPIPIYNNLTLNDYEKMTPLVMYIPNDVEATLHWHLRLPVSYYEVTLAPQKTIKGEFSDHSTNITGNCSTVAWNEVRCLLTLPEGCYHANFQHVVAWSAVLNGKTSVDFNFCRSHVETPVVKNEGTDLLWACGGIVLAGLAFITLVIARRVVNIKNYHKQVLQAWRTSRDGEQPEPLRASGPTVVVLYAREGAHGRRAIAALTALLEGLTAGQVVDLYSEQTVALAGSAPGAWLHAVLQAPLTKVLLVQSPALALYAAPLAESDLTLQAPLLGRRAMYRTPQFGDQLLLLALRLLGESAAAHHNYHKYYLATYNTLETDIVKQVVPYRRYVLPDAAGTLARDLGASPPHHEHAHLLEKFSAAAEEFIAHVTHNPEYLVDELLIM